MNTMIRIPMMELTGLYRVLARKKEQAYPSLKKLPLEKMISGTIGKVGIRTT